MSDSTSLETGPPRSADYMRRLELAMGRINDAACAACRHATDCEC